MESLRQREQQQLSVLALSSRFDGRLQRERSHARYALSVLALSSRFDGPPFKSFTISQSTGFQYSLCRVVLMVKQRGFCVRIYLIFQYSLCRVVLMVWH